MRSGDYVSQPSVGAIYDPSRRELFTAETVGATVVGAREPDLPHARELVVVRRLHEDRLGRSWVETWDMAYSGTHHNEESRFREACVRTAFNRFPAELFAKLEAFLGS